MKNPTLRKDLPVDLQHIPIEYLDEMMTVRLESWVKDKIQDVGDYHEVSMSTVVVNIFKGFIEYIELCGMDAFKPVGMKRKKPKMKKNKEQTPYFSFIEEMEYQ
jgi:hypothetical protein